MKTVIINLRKNMRVKVKKTVIMMKTRMIVTLVAKKTIRRSLHLQEKGKLRSNFHQRLKRSNQVLLRKVH